MHKNKKMFKIILSIIINWTCYSNSFWIEYWEIYGDYMINRFREQIVRTN